MTNQRQVIEAVTSMDRCPFCGSELRRKYKCWQFHGKGVQRTGKGDEEFPMYRIDARCMEEYEGQKEDDRIES